jgi:uncharacterized protein
MPLLTKLQDDLKTAMRAKDVLARDTLRMVLAEMKNRRIELGHELKETDQEAVLARCVKTRRDSFEQYEKAGRSDLAEKERAEISVIEGYLPEQLSEDEVRAAVKAAIETSGAKSKKDLGAVMKALMVEHKGRIEGKVAQRFAAELLD